MTSIEGGLRVRLIRDSLEELVRSTLDQRGWFDAGRQHSPIRFISEPNDWNEPIEVNSVAIAGGDITSTEWEMGSQMTEDRWTFYVDFYGENEAIGTDVSGDISASLRGKLPSIGRNDSVLDVLDFRDPDTPVLFHCLIETVVTDRARDYPKPWLRWWYSVRCEIVDENDS